MDELLTVIVPAFNEERTIEAVLDRLAGVRNLPIPLEVIVVDDGSTDTTVARIAAWCERHVDRAIEVRVVSKANGGKGSAVRTGLVHARGTWVVVHDADLEYDPSDLASLLTPLREGKADVVYGSRNLGLGTRGALHFYWGGRLVTAVANALYGSSLTDEATCYKMFPTALLRSLELTAEGFELCPEMTAKALRRGKKILEVPIHYHPRSVDEGKKIRPWHGVEAVAELWKWRRFR